MDFLYKKLEISKLKKTDKELLKDERRLKQIEQRVLNMREKMDIKGAIMSIQIFQKKNHL